MANLIRRIGNRVSGKAKLVVEDVVGRMADRMVEKAKVDPRIAYPSYMPFDEFIDVERLKALDGYLIEKIHKHMQAERDEAFDSGPMKLEKDAKRQPGSKIIWLTKSKRGYRYMDLDVPELWERTPAAEEFSELMDFIATMPFKVTARMLIIYDDSGRPVTAHRDHAATEARHDFIWFRPNLSKRFFTQNRKTNEKKYVESYSAWFDTCNQFHGADGSEGLSISLRVDGRFTDEFRAKIPVPPYNLASTPSFWACTQPQA